MDGYSPKLPLQRDENDSLYLMNRTSRDSIKQNFKNLLLTNPGEKIMDNNFGIGLRTYLFSQNTEQNRNTIEVRIKSQVNKYLKYINIDDIIIQTNENNENAISIMIKYSIPALKVEDEIIV